MRVELIVVLAEALDRLSRDQEHIAGLFKRLRFSGVRLFTSSEGEISELHVGLKGTINALFLKDLAAKTHRGLEGRVRQGLSAGGLTFGYDVSGEAGGARGGRRINDPEAVVVERIFRELAAGKSPLAIAKQLNAEAILGPGGRPWPDTTIRGHAIRGTGVLRNELYIGRLIWNRLRYAKDPDTGKRLSRLSPTSEWVIEAVPDLRIIEQGLWKQVAGRLADMRAAPRVTKQRESRFWEHRRPKHFTTGRISCGGCGNAMAVIGKDYFGCNHARRRGTCGNRAAIRRSEIERLVLDGLKKQLMAPDLLKAFIDSFHHEVNRQRGEQAADRRARERELPALKQRIHSLVDAIASGVRTSAVVSALEEAEAQKVAVEAELVAPAPTLVRLHPALGDLYRQRVTELHVGLPPSSRRRQQRSFAR